MSSIQYVPLGIGGFRCTIVTTARESQQRFIELSVPEVATDAEPQLVGDEEYQANQALIGNLLSYGSHEFAARQAEEEEQRASNAKAAQRFSAAALQIAEYANLGGYKSRKGWCSSCFELTEHREVDGNFKPAVHLCQGCGETMSLCAAPGCRHLARRPHGTIRVPPFCAEHRHELRSFAKSARTYDSLDAIDDLRSFESKNLRGLTRTVAIAGAGIAVVAPMAVLAAPALAGALGASGLIGPALSGAAASSHGLAFLGGGTLAAGGFGMAGGTAVVAATGAALGGTMGALTASAYLQDDKSFRIEKLREGVGAPVLVASGFLTEGETGWGNWEKTISDRYPDNPVYRVHWGAKELKALTRLLGGVAGGAAFTLATQGAKKATKAGAKLLPGLSTALVAKDLVANPWHVARSRAEQTATVLADLLARVQSPHFILAGHSLGARVMLRTAELLATKGGAPRLESVHLLGAAVGVGGDWKLLNDSVVDRVSNYYSTNDDTLKLIYAAAQGGQKAVGYAGFGTTFPSIEDIDVSADVPSHRHYLESDPKDLVPASAPAESDGVTQDDGWAEWILGGDAKQE